MLSSTSTPADMIFFCIFDSISALSFFLSPSCTHSLFFRPLSQSSIRQLLLTTPPTLLFSRSPPVRPLSVRLSQLYTASHLYLVNEDNPWFDPTPFCARDTHPGRQISRQSTIKIFSLLLTDTKKHPISTLAIPCRRCSTRCSHTLPLIKAFGLCSPASTPQHPSPFHLQSAATSLRLRRHPPSPSLL